MSRKEILFFKQCCGETTPEEDKVIKDLLDSSIENREEMETVRKIVSIEEQIAGMSSIDTDEGYRRMMQKAHRYESRRHIGHFLLPICAALALPLSVSTGVLAYLNLDMKEQLAFTGWQEIRTAPGTTTSFELPDHSRVWLNSGSSLRYPSRFSDGERMVELAGEAYFEVEADPGNPFCVSTGSGLETVAYGTEFNVSAYPDDDYTETVLAEGVVSIRIAGEEKCQLEPGESGKYCSRNGQLEIGQVNTYEKTAWREGKMIFRNASLEEVFERLGRRYNIDFEFHDPYSRSGRYRCRITFRDETIQQIMGYLKIAAPIRWKIYPAPVQNGNIIGRQRIEVWLDKDRNSL